ncbi:hypothetical protein HSX11_21060 [Oxalobacteraceae bacterium]|nr:hypothetical protein [Oxalobacteraceae bacterium]
MIGSHFLAIYSCRKFLNFCPANTSIAAFSKCASRALSVLSEYAILNDTGRSGGSHLAVSGKSYTMNSTAATAVGSSAPSSKPNAPMGEDVKELSAECME